jgi:hypothetical protein
MSGKFDVRTMTTFKKSYLCIWTFAVTLVSITTAQAQILSTPPDHRNRSEVKSVLAKAPKISVENLRGLHIVLLASEKDHGLNEHDYPLWQKNWTMLLGGAKNDSEATQTNMFGPANNLDRDEMMAGAPNVKVTTAWEWPSKEQFQSADLIVAFSVVNWNRDRNAELNKFLSQGGGFVVIHMSCVVADGVGLDAKWLT